MSRRPNILRRAAQAYIEYIDSAADKTARAITGALRPSAKPTPNSSTTTSTTTSNPTPTSSTISTTTSTTTATTPVTKPIPPACFSVTTTANNNNLITNLVHYLNYKRQPPSRTIFSLTPTDTSDAFRILDDRPFGGRTEARACIVEREAESGAAGSVVRVLRYEGVLHPLPPFQSKGSRWMEDIIRPAVPNTDAPSTSSSSASSSSAPALVGPTGLTTPVGQLNGFSSLTSPNYSYPDLNLSPYSHLALRLRTDGRPYTLSIRCHERLPLVYQARIPASQPRPMHWSEIRFEHFLTTFQGQMQTLQFSLPRGRVASWGLSVTGPPGPFWLELECVEARRGLTVWEKGEMSDEERGWREEEEKRKSGERFLWWLDDNERAMLERFGNKQLKDEEHESRAALVRRDEDEVRHDSNGKVVEEATQEAHKLADNHDERPQQQQQQPKH